MLLSDLTNILVIDDNDTDLLIAKIVIEKAGFKGTIITKNSGKGALEYIGSVISTPEKWPSIVFLDINMPVVNGFAFLFEYERLGEEFRNSCKIAVLTSSDNKSDVDRFLVNEYVVDFVSKPISIEGFNKVVEKIQ